MIEHDFVGVDIAKDKFDANLLYKDKPIKKTFNNTKNGIIQFHNWINKHTSNTWVCLESTGHYGEQLAEFLYKNMVRVSMVNPMPIKQFIKLRLTRNKNDAVDARMIREFAEIYKPRIFQPRPNEQKILRELIQLLDTLKKQKIKLNNQLDALQTSEAKKEFKNIIRMIDRKEKYLEKKINDTVNKYESLSESINSLTEIKGIGKLSAYRIMAYLPDVNNFNSAKQLAAYVGVSPRQCESGRYKGKTRMSKFGNAKLRNALYMPALVAKCFNEPLQPFVKRLEKNGLAPKAIIGAVMRKLIHIIYGMLKNKQPFNKLLV